jgi:hypothetical protein
MSIEDIQNKADALPNPDIELCVEDFHAYMPMHNYIFAPTREVWPASSVNARVPPPIGPNGKPIKASDWLDNHRPVEQMTWAPGMPTVLRDTLVSNGGLINRPGCSVFNLYRAPEIEPGDPGKAGPWLTHLRHVYPDDHGYIAHWLAHRVQRPGEKINHALVLGGEQGIGKDSILEPIKRAVGPWNFEDVTPAHMLGRFNGFVKSVILRVSEARDLGEVDRYAFYEHMKVYTAAPPDVLRCDEKNLREYSVLNVCGVIITTNHKTDGFYLPPDDRRHYVAWSTLTKEMFQPEYWTTLYGWYENGGHGHVAAHLRQLDISTFNPKAPPPKTRAWHDIVDSNRAPEDAEIADALDALSNPPAVTLDKLTFYAPDSLKEFLQDRRSRRQIPHRLEAAGYAPLRNDTAKDGLWKVDGRRQVVYVRRELAVRDQLLAARQLVEGRWARQ